MFGLPAGRVLEDRTTDPVARREGLAAAAVAWFLADLEDPPVELEATQADVAELVTSLSGAGADPAVDEALDAIDDGLPADAVALRLQRLLPPGADALEILRDRLVALN